MFPLAQAATPFIPPPPTPDSGESVGLWGLYVAFLLLIAAVAGLWRQHMKNESRRVAAEIAREKREEVTEGKRIDAARLEAESRTNLANAFREFTDVIRGCPAHEERRSSAAKDRALRAMDGTS